MLESNISKSCFKFHFLYVDEINSEIIKKAVKIGKPPSQLPTTLIKCIIQIDES